MYERDIPYQKMKWHLQKPLGIKYNVSAPSNTDEITRLVYVSKNIMNTKARNHPIFQNLFLVVSEETLNGPLEANGSESSNEKSRLWSKPPVLLTESNLVRFFRWGEGSESCIPKESYLEKLSKKGPFDSMLYLEGELPDLDTGVPGTESSKV